MDKLKDIFKSNWGKISFSYLLFTISSLLVILYPKVLGDTIDHLIAKDYSYIGYLVSVFFGIMIFGYISRLYDVKIFSEIHKNFASKEICKQIDNNVETSKINGRVNLLSIVISFFEHDLVSVLQSFYTIIGSIYFISLVDMSLVPYLLLSAVFILITSYYFVPKLTKITKLSNNLVERQTDIIVSKNKDNISYFFATFKKLAIKMSVIDAKFSFFIQFIVYGTVTSLLTYYIMYNTVTVGKAFSTYRYLFDFSTAIIMLPNIIESYINIKDVLRRLE